MQTGLIRHRIFDELRDAIMSCALQPGSELREGELAQQYGVSKSPIRDALQKLEFEGLVQIASRQGHRVVPISVGDAHDILDLRETLEQAAVKKVVAEAVNKDLESLNKFRVGIWQHCGPSPLTTAIFTPKFADSRATPANRRLCKA